MSNTTHKKSTEELAESALFLIRNFSKTQMALALAYTYRTGLPLAAMYEWAPLGPLDLLSITNGKNGGQNGKS